ncbi:MAG: hypothetical protein JOY84_10510 [Curvibacter sp.]|nr:hypothetical protein [Curvibacter sp.]
MNSPGRIDALGGRLHLRPGLGRPHNLHSDRQDWAARLAPGRHAADWPALLGRLLSLCGQSQQLCARLALQAARGLQGQTDDADRLRQETLREHLRRILLDWPRLLGPDAALTAQAQQALNRCPGLGPAPAHPALLDWLAEDLLQEPVRLWLQHWQADPAGWLRDWSGQGRSWLAALLDRTRPLLDQARPACPPLPFPQAEADWLALAGPLASDPGFSVRPLWHGGCAETGPWSRQRQPHPEAFDTPWLRLGARLAELLRLALPDQAPDCGRHWLRQAGFSPRPGEGLGAVEMARGLLVHRVRLDDSGERLVEAQVLAPTEWNFHPLGPVALALENPPAASGVRPYAQALVCAYDPCVPHEIDEVTHA